MVNAFSTENKKLKQINYNLNEQYENMSKVLFYLNKKYKEKQKLIVNLQKKVNALEKGLNKKNTGQNQRNNNCKNPMILNIENKNNVNKNEQNKKIFELNKQNLEDLDALYFYDKIKEGKKRAVSIPKIEIKQQVEENDEEEEEEYENDDMNRTVAFSNIWGLFISLGDVKFKSKNFIKIKEAFLL